MIGNKKQWWSWWLNTKESCRTLYSRFWLGKPAGQGCGSDWLWEGSRPYLGVGRSFPEYPMPHKAPGVMESNTEWYKVIHVFRGAPLKSVRRYRVTYSVKRNACRMIQNNLFFSSPRWMLPARRLFEGTSVKWGCTRCTTPLVPDTPRPFLQSSTLDIDAGWCSALLKSNISIKE